MDSKTLTKIQSNFVKELKDAQKGAKTSLAFIVHKIPSSSLVKENEIFESLVIGGTVAKKAILKKTKNGIKILKKENDKILNLKGENDLINFFNKDVEDDIDILAVNFAYPLKPVFENGKLDGVLLRVTKEGSFHQLVGRKVGEEIEKYIFQKKKKRIKVSVANDTVCLLLSGLTKFSFQNLAAGVVGTGINFAIFLNNNHLVNLESANFDKFSQSKIAKEIDENSLQKGVNLFEKETAGAYLYKHFNLIIKEKNISYLPISSTEELSSLCHPEFISGSKFSQNKMPKQVRHDIATITKDLLLRSAQLVACQIAGIMEFKKSDITFVMEGSLFWKGNNYKETVVKTLGLLSNFKAKFIEIENSAILGAGKLVS